jgi:hypothetical protein
MSLFRSLTLSKGDKLPPTFRTCELKHYHLSASRVRTSYRISEDYRVAQR